jgi:hypothetical protein
VLDLYAAKGLENAAVLAELPEPQTSRPLEELARSTERPRMARPHPTRPRDHRPTRTRPNTHPPATPRTRPHVTLRL